MSPEAPAHRGAPAPPQRIRVMVVEDEGLFRELLCSALTARPRFEVVRSFAGAAPALAAAAALRPDVAILDVQLGGSVNGVQLGLQLRRSLPGLGVVLLSNFLEPEFLAAVPAREMAGWCYLLKRSVADLATLERAVEGAAMGLVVLDPALARHLSSERAGSLGRLTQRQREILALVAQGFTNAAIADQLHLSLKSVENHINGLYQELGIDRADRNVHPRVKAVIQYLGELSGRSAEAAG